MALINTTTTIKAKKKVTLLARVSSSNRRANASNGSSTVVRRDIALNVRELRGLLSGKKKRIKDMEEQWENSSSHRIKYSTKTTAHTATKTTAPPCPAPGVIVLTNLHLCVTR